MEETLPAENGTSQDAARIRPRAEQLPLELPHRPAFSREDFLVTPASEDAMAWIDAWPDWPDGGGRLPGLALHGPAGCGKSHLAHVWLRLSQGQLLPLGDLVEHAESLSEEDRKSLAPALLDRAPPHLLLDGIEGSGLFESRAAQTLLFHLHHGLVERRGSLLIAARNPPARWPLLLPDLASRLSALASVPMGAPDDALLEAVLVKLFADRQLRPPPDVLHYLGRHMQRSFEAARTVVAGMDRLSMARNRGLTIPLAREVLAQFDAAPGDSDPEA